MHTDLIPFESCDEYSKYVHLGMRNGKFDSALWKFYNSETSPIKKIALGGNWEYGVREKRYHMKKGTNKRIKLETKFFVLS